MPKSKPKPASRPKLAPRTKRRPKIVHDTEREFAAVCSSLGALAPGSSLVIGCSAGGDSMALLALCARVRERFDWRLTVAHLDHAQRSESRSEAEFVSARCRELGVVCITGRLRPIRAGNTRSEDRMREARHKFFAGALEKSGAVSLLLAHQADDRAETFLMRLFSGSGPTGLASIRQVESLRGKDGQDGLIVIRPLLSIRRATLREYLTARGLDWREDPSNADTRRKRAWVRGEILPQVNDRMEHDIVPHIVRAGELIESESRALDQAARTILDLLVSDANAPATERLDLRNPIWKYAGDDLRRVIVRRWIWRLSRRAHPPGFRTVDEAVKFAARAARGSRLRTIGRMILIKQGGFLVAYPPGEEPE